MSLHPCPCCARHVRRDEHSCPFCQSVLPTRRPAPRKQVGRLARAAVFAGATLLTTACGDDAGSDAPPREDAATGTDSGGGTDSAVAMDSGRVDAGGGTDAGDGTDAGRGVDAGDLPDAAALPDVGVALPYGAPPVRDRLA